MSSVLKVEIPGLPPAECSPNSRVPWYGKLGVARVYKENVTMLGNLERNKAQWTAPDMAKVHVTFVLPDHRRRDRDNLIARAKPLLDALGPWRETQNLKHKVVSAYGADIIKDDCPKHATITYELTYEKGRTVTIVEVIHG